MTGPVRPDTRRVRIAVDVSEVAPVGATDVVADVFLPTDVEVPAPRVVLCCLPGGGMSRGYFDLGVPSDPGDYSMAAHLAARGCVVVTIDPPGVGESPAPDDGYALTPNALADVHAFVVDRVLVGMRDGSLLPGVGPVPELVPIGVGHSAGAALTVFQQARHRSYRAIALLGFRGRGLPDFLTEEEARCADDPAAVERDIVGLTRSRFGEPLPLGATGSSPMLIGVSIPEAARDALHATNSNMLAVVGLTTMIPGACDAALGVIDVPVFLGVGDRDITGDPDAIPAELPAAPEVTLFVLDEAGHNHNVAPTRARLWDRLASWATSLGLSDRASAADASLGTRAAPPARPR